MTRPNLRYCRGANSPRSEDREKGTVWSPAGHSALWSPAKPNWPPRRSSSSRSLTALQARPHPPSGLSFPPSSRHVRLEARRTSGSSGRLAPGDIGLGGPTIRPRIFGSAVAPFVATARLHFRRRAEPRSGMTESHGAFIPLRGVFDGGGQVAVSAGRARAGRRGGRRRDASGDPYEARQFASDGGDHDLPRLVPDRHPTTAPARPGRAFRAMSLTAYGTASTGAGRGA